MCWATSSLPLPPNWGIMMKWPASNVGSSWSSHARPSDRIMGPSEWVLFLLSSDGVLQKENISAHVPMPAMRAAGQSATQGVSIIAGFCHLCDIPSSAQHSTAQGMRRGEDAGTVKLDAATGSDIYWLHDAATLLRYSSRGADDLLV